MEVFFLDVGQGSSNVILLGDQRAVVIDAGPACKDLLLRTLKAHHVNRIERLIISHGHNDHTEGAVAVLNEYAGRIERIGVLADPALATGRFGKRLMLLVEEGKIDCEKIDPPIANSTQHPYYHDPKTGARFVVYSPDHYQNVVGSVTANPNRTSVVLALETDRPLVVFGGDATIDQWRQIHAKHGTIDCDIFTVPHHGGLLGDAAGDLPWLFGTAIRSQHAVLSVGSSNAEKHPRPEVVRELRFSGCSVLCTQITPQCCQDLEVLRPGVSDLLNPSRHSSDVKQLTDSGKSKNVACAGTIVAEIRSGAVSIRGRRSHQEGIDRLVKSGSTPLCRN